ncbi:MAG: protein tyrosine kinase [Chloroflexota bacterium]|nr:MAG: protein tyrosine kinase [Chloroflexota bacterium]
MEPQPLSDDIRRYSILIWHWAWLIILATILAAGTAYFVSQRMTPIYQASSTLLVNEAPGTQGTDYSSVMTSQRLTQTYAEMLTKQPVLDEVIDQLSLPMEASDLKRTITVQPVRDTQLIDIKVEEIDPVRAAAIANAVGIAFANQNKAMQEARYASTKESLKSQLDDIQLQIDGISTSLAALGDVPESQAERERLDNVLSQYRQTYAYTLQSYEQVRLAEAETISNVVQAENAVPPKGPISPKVFQNTALAGVVGAMLAVGVIFLIEALDDTIRSPDEVERYLQLPVLGVIRGIEDTEELIAAAQPRAPVSEAFRSLRTNIQYASVDHPLNSILITSATQGEGKTTVAANLSSVLAQGGKRVSLIDADLRRPRLHSQMNISNRRGLTSLFMGQDIQLNGALRESRIPNLSLITSGNLPPNPAELLGSEKMQQILAKVEAQSDVVILDSPPVIAVTDATVLSQRVDGVLLVIQPGTAKVAAIQKAIEQLRRVGANVIGVVLNNVASNSSRYSYYYYYYYADDYYGDRRRQKRKKKKK